MAAPQKDDNPELPQRVFPLECYDNFLKQYELQDDMQTSAVYQVYQDLRLIRGWTNLKIVFSKKRRPYIIGSAAIGYDSVYPNKEDENGDRTQAVIPVPTTELMTPKMLHDIKAEFGSAQSEKPLRCVTMAIVDADSTTAYYRIFNDVNEILHPQWKQKKDDKGEASDED